MSPPGPFLFSFCCLVHSDVAESRPCAVGFLRVPLWGAQGLPLTAAVCAAWFSEGAAAVVQPLTPAVELCDTGSFLQADLHLQMSAQAGVV